MLLQGEIMRKGGKGRKGGTAKSASTGGMISAATFLSGGGKA